MIRASGGAALVAACAAAAAAAPLWTYALSLALFGLPHVLVELRYVDERFAARLPRHTVRWLALGLAGIVLLRALAVAGLGDAGLRGTTELVLGVGLVAAATPLLASHAASPVAFGVGVALAAGVLTAPLATLVVLALLHNLTPVGFLAERLRGAERRRALLLAAVAFGLVPALLLLQPFPAIALTGPLSTGHLDEHLPAFVPTPLLGTPFADRLFAAAAYLQCMHYAVVLGVLPRLSGGSETAHALLRWPRRRVFAAAVAALGVVAALEFAGDFVGTRRVYAVVAALHAWIEIPVLVVACGVLPRFERRAALPA